MQGRGNVRAAGSNGRRGRNRPSHNVRRDSGRRVTPATSGHPRSATVPSGRGCPSIQIPHRKKGVTGGNGVTSEAHEAVRRDSVLLPAELRGVTVGYGSAPWALRHPRHPDNARARPRPDICTDRFSVLTATHAADAVSAASPTRASTRRPLASPRTRSSRAIHLSRPAVQRAVQHGALSDRARRLR